MQNFIFPISKKVVVKLIPVLIPAIISLVLAGSAFGYEITALAQTSNQPCSSSFPCVKICGDHPCKPGEVYTVGSSTSKSNSSQTEPANQTVSPKGMPKIPENMTISANMTAAKVANGTTTGQAANVTSGSVPPAPKQLSPRAQVSAGTPAANVKCLTGFDLVLNLYDSRPACIKSDDLSKFLARGWGKTA